MSSKKPTKTVVELYETLRDSRIEDMLALVDPEVICQPLVRAGLSVYYSHPGQSAASTPSATNLIASIESLNDTSTP